MQKHSDRPDKRPAILQQGIAGVAAGGGVGGGGGGGGQPGHQVGHGGGHGHGGGGQNAAVASMGANQHAAAAAAAAGLPGLAGSAAADAYWPKMDPYGVGVGHERDYGLMDPR